MDIAYQLFISSVEAMANDALRSFTPTESEMMEKNKSIAKLAVEFGLPEDKARKLAIEVCKKDPWSGRKFTKFILDNTDDMLWAEDELFKVPSDFLPKKDNFKSALSRLYRMRGKATHRGRSYPAIARVGTGPTIPSEAMLNIGEMLKPDGPFPPITWFERVTNYSLCGFLHQSMTASDI